MHFFTDASRSTTRISSGQRYRGPEAARRGAVQLMSGFGDVEVLDFRLVPAGDRVVALLHTARQGRARRPRGRAARRHTITFRDGKDRLTGGSTSTRPRLSPTAGLDPGLASAGTGPGSDQHGVLLPWWERHDEQKARSALIALGSPRPGRSGRSTADQQNAGGRHGEPRRIWRGFLSAPRAIPPGTGVRSFARDVSFAVIDASIGLRGLRPGSTVQLRERQQVLLLAAELRRLDREGLPLDSGQGLLEPMITYSTTAPPTASTQKGRG